VGKGGPALLAQVPELPGDRHLLGMGPLGPCYCPKQGPHSLRASRHRRSEGSLGMGPPCYVHGGSRSSCGHPGAPQGQGWAVWNSCVPPSATQVIATLLSLPAAPKEGFSAPW
jgi:hypothetical protein